MSLCRVLGVESSCDETAVAVLTGDGRVEASLLASQVTAHRPFGGVVPEIASREHLESLPRLVDVVLGESDSPPQLVAVTAGPGLVGSLLVGVRFAAAFAWARGLPLVAVDHLEGHLASPFLRLDGRAADAVPEPTLALVASGGHSSWYLLSRGNMRRLGRTRDDAAGEAFDKVAQAVGLPYPGGPVVDRLARRGNPQAVDLPRPRLADAPLDFSFSGLKSAAIREIRAAGLFVEEDEETPPEVCDLLASFEAAVVDHLLGPLPELTARHRPKALAVAGGVAANTRLREQVTAAASALGCDVRLAPKELTTDNAAMIGRAGQLAYARGVRHDPRSVDVTPRRAWQPPGMRNSA